MSKPTLIGPFKQIVTLQELPIKGALMDEQLQVISEGGVSVLDGQILEVKRFSDFWQADYDVKLVEEDMVLIPGLVDCHTHLVWGGNRARDYSMRMAGKTYQEILAAGGGIFDTVAKTQAATFDELSKGLQTRAKRHLSDGVTTIEVKTGYGLEVAQELKMLQVIRDARSVVDADLVATCLAAHVCPKDYELSQFLALIENELLPEVLVKGLAKRVDVFVEENAFPTHVAKPYLMAAKKLGFELVIHADQFTPGGSRLAVEVGALSADHLEASGVREIEMLATSDVISVALPGASLGLGMNYTPARKLLDAGASLAIASDWNPGSAPMGDLLVQAALLGIYEKLSTAELLAGLTYRAAGALGLPDRGQIITEKKADFIAFPLKDYREIFYYQGKVKPSKVWKSGRQVI